MYFIPFSPPLSPPIHGIAVIWRQTCPYPHSLGSSSQPGFCCLVGDHIHPAQDHSFQKNLFFWSNIFPNELPYMSLSPSCVAVKTEVIRNQVLHIPKGAVRLHNTKYCAQVDLLNKALMMQVTHL